MTQAPKDGNLFSNLEEVARRLPSRTAVAVAIPDGRGGRRYEELTFAQLVEQIRRCSAGLVAHGVKKGTRVLILARPSIGFMVFGHALLRLGAVPVFIDAGGGPEQILALVAESESGAMIMDPEAHVLRELRPEAFETVRLLISTAGDMPNAVPFAHLLDATHPAVETSTMTDDDLAAIVFTSGSTGLPKGVEVDIRTLHAGCAPLRTLQLSERDIYLAVLPSYLFQAPTLGATAVIPDMDFGSPGKADPRSIVQQLQERSVSFSIGAPSLWSKVAAYCEAEDITLPALRCLLLGGAPVGLRDLERLKRMLPNGECHTPIGATEGAPFADITATEILRDTAPRTLMGHGVCVGRIIADHELRIIALSDRAFTHWNDVEILPRGQIGEMMVTGPLVSKRYFRRPEANQFAKVVDPEGRVWHRVGDAGYFDDTDRLWFCGRVAHTFERAGRRWFPIMIESVFNSLEGVTRTAAVGVVDPASNDSRFTVIVEQPNGEGADSAGVRQRILDRAREVDLPVDDVLFFPRQFPVDARHNAKIDHVALRRWAEGKRIG